MFKLVIDVKGLDKFFRRDLKATEELNYYFSLLRFHHQAYMNEESILRETREKKQRIRGFFSFVINSLVNLYIKQNFVTKAYVE